jgi:hypothetical protein
MTRLPWLAEQNTKQLPAETIPTSSSFRTELSLGGSGHQLWKRKADFTKNGLSQAREVPVSAKKKATSKPKKDNGTLKGWAAIGVFLSLPPVTAQRWARDGMPVRKEGRFTLAEPAELEAWLGRESHMAAPAKVVNYDTDLAAALRQSIKAAGGGSGSKSKK